MCAEVVADIDSAVVEFRSADGEPRSAAVRLAPTSAMFEAAPWRTFRWYKGQRHYSGWYWSATENDHVIYESLMELAALLLADFDIAVHKIVAQPFHLVAHVNGKEREHTPDYLLVTDDGPVVLDVMRAERLSQPKAQFMCAWTRQVLEYLDWRYEVVTELEPTMLANVRFLAGYRREWLINAEILGEFRSRAKDLVGSSVDCAEKQIADGRRPLVRSALLHLLWRQEFTVDLNSPLSRSTILEEPR